MKISQLLSGPLVVLTNEELNFIDTNGSEIPIEKLEDRSLWVGQNLVRKGIYKISNDNQYLLKNVTN